MSEQLLRALNECARTHEMIAKTPGISVTSVRPATPLQKEMLKADFVAQVRVDPCVRGESSTPLPQRIEVMSHGARRVMALIVQWSRSPTD